MPNGACSDLPMSHACTPLTCCTCCGYCGCAIQGSWLAPRARRVPHPWLSLPVTLQTLKSWGFAWQQAGPLGTAFALLVLLLQGFVEVRGAPVKCGLPAELFVGSYAHDRQTLVEQPRWTPRCRLASCQLRWLPALPQLMPSTHTLCEPSRPFRPPLCPPQVYQETLVWLPGKGVLLQARRRCGYKGQARALKMERLEGATIHEVRCAPLPCRVAAAQPAEGL